MQTVNMQPPGARMPPLGDSVAHASEGISLVSAIRAVRRRKRLIFGTLLAVNALALGAVLAISPRYSATTTLMIDLASPRGSEWGTVGTAAPNQAGDPSLIPTQVNLLKSPALALLVITALGLEKDPELRPSMSLQMWLHRWLLDQSMSTAVADWLPTLPSALPISDAQAAVPKFLDRLSGSQQRESRMITISYKSGDPNKAANVANAVVRQYMDMQVDVRLKAAERAYHWVGQRVTELSRQLQEAEDDVTNYMAANGLPRVGSNVPDAQQPPSLRRELAVARADRATKEGRLAQLRELQARRASYESLPEVGGSPIIQVLQQQAGMLRAQEAQRVSQYGPNHPSLQQMRAQRESIDRRISAEIDNIVRGIADDTTRARARERELEQSLRDSLREYGVSEAASVRLNELTRMVDTMSTLYRTLLERLETISDQRGLVNPGAELVAAAAVPLDRDFPQLRIMFGAGILGSLVLALGLTALAEHLDRGLHAAHDVERTLGLPTLALVPRVKQGRRRGRPHSYVFNRPQSAYAEAIRALILGVEQSMSRAAKVLVVASTLPGEGKTTLAISLAAMAVRCGRRTVIVDLDLRHPSVARELGLQAQAGLLEYVHGHYPLDKVVQTAPEDARLHVIALRGPVVDPADVLDSPRLKGLITLLRQYYDTVLLDVPPALGITDAAAIGLLADGALFVAQWGATTEGAAVNGVAALQRAGVSIIGCVLTQVDLRRHALYGSHDAGEFYRTYRRYFHQ